MLALRHVVRRPNGVRKQGCYRFGDRQLDRQPAALRARNAAERRQLFAEYPVLDDQAPVAPVLMFFHPPSFPPTAAATAFQALSPGNIEGQSLLPLAHGQSNFRANRFQSCN